MNKKIIYGFFGFVIIVSFFSTGCIALKKNNGKVSVYIQKEDSNFTRNSVMILNFNEPEYTKGKGKSVAEIFHRNLLKSKKFRMVMLKNDSDWCKYETTEEKSLLAAIDEGRNEKVDFIFVGEIKDYLFGGLNKTKVKLRVRVIDVRSKITYFLCEGYQEDIGDDVAHPLSTKLTDKSAIPEKIIDEISRRIIDKL